MKISTKGRYALRMLLDLAQHHDEGYISLTQVAARQGISKNYLEQIINLLKGTTILVANRGAQGGYKLAYPPSHYTVGQILRLTEGGLAPVTCLEKGAEYCQRQEECMTLAIWQGLEKVIAQYLDGITLQDILDGGCDLVSEETLK